MVPWWLWLADMCSDASLLHTGVLQGAWRDMVPWPALTSQEQLDTADVPYHFRDYCAHMWIDYKECRTNNPVLWRKTCKQKLPSL